MHGRVFEADADQFHAVVGFDHHLCEVRFRRYAADGDDLHAQPIAQAIDDELVLARILARVADTAAELGEELVQTREAFFGRID